MSGTKVKSLDFGKVQKKLASKLSTLANSVDKSWQQIYIDTRSSADGTSRSQKIRLLSLDKEPQGPKSGKEIDNLVSQLWQAKDSAPEKESWYGITITVARDGTVNVQFNHDPECIEGDDFWELGDSDHMSLKEHGRLLDEASDARHKYFHSLGQPDSDVWFPIINPAFIGGPAWPTRPAWQRIRKTSEQPNQEINFIVSCGLTNPFGDANGPNIGFGVEIAVATAENVNENLRTAWLMELAEGISNLAAQDGRFNLRQEKFSVFLMGIRKMSDRFSHLADAEGYVGILLGLPIPGVDHQIPLPAGNAVLIAAKLLMKDEYEYVAAQGLEAAIRLKELFEKDGSNYNSTLKRASVLG